MREHGVGDASVGVGGSPRQGRRSERGGSGSAQRSVTHMLAPLVGTSSLRRINATLTLCERKARRRCLCSGHACGHPLPSFSHPCARPHPASHICHKEGKLRSVHVSKPTRTTCRFVRSVRLEIVTFTYTRFHAMPAKAKQPIRRQQPA